MPFHVVITERAKADLRHYHQRAAAQAPMTADRWLDRFEEALAGLSSNPDRCPLAPESDRVESEIRQLRFGRRGGAFRVLFAIRDDTVLVLHIRRASMDDATPDDLIG